MTNIDKLVLWPYGWREPRVANSLLSFSGILQTIWRAQLANSKSLSLRLVSESLTYEDELPLFVETWDHVHKEQTVAMGIAIDTKATEKVCPLCSEEYPEGDIYCGKDGTRLVSSDPNVLSSGALADR
jgi:hypothetical protein